MKAKDEVEKKAPLQIEGEELPRVVTMKMKHAPPPGFEEMLRVFPFANRAGVMFCFGDTIYNPSKVRVPQWIVEHEAIHMKQQLNMGVEAWWKRYLIDVNFRLDQEVPAHQAEYRCFCEMNPRDRNARRRALRDMAARLSGVLYGRMIRFEDAQRLIKNRKERVNGDSQGVVSADQGADL